MERSETDRLREAAARVELLLMDCDGVLTDGRLYFSSSGEELKVFHVHDGEALVRWHRSGFSSGVVTGRSSAMLVRRVEELGVHFLEQGVGDKSAKVKEILQRASLDANQAAFIGDDLGDIPPMELVGFPIAVANCLPDVGSVAVYKTIKNGGFGAVREAVDLLLQLKSEA